MQARGRSTGALNTGPVTGEGRPAFEPQFRRQSARRPPDFPLKVSGSLLIDYATANSFAIDATNSSEQATGSRHGARNGGYRPANWSSGSAFDFGVIIRRAAFCPSMLTTGLETLPGSSCPHPSMCRSDATVAESVPQSSSASAERE